MNPGRELDALVAEKVMGWRLGWFEQEGRPPKEYWFSSSGEYWFSDSLPEMSVEDFTPSTHCEPAWDVHSTVMNRKNSRRPIYVAALRMIYSPPYTDISDMNEEIVFMRYNPFNICLAAMKAYGVEV